MSALPTRARMPASSASCSLGSAIHSSARGDRRAVWTGPAAVPVRTASGPPPGMPPRPIQPPRSCEGLSWVDPGETYRTAAAPTGRPKFRRWSGVNRKLPVILLVAALAVLAAFSLVPLVASDHDDGEADLKGRALNITDLYAFREKDQNPGAADGDLVFIMNVNPRSLPRHHYYFSTNAAY